MKILLVGPFDTKGRYEGGIAYIVNSVISNEKIYKSKGLQIKKLDVCRLKRKMTDQGKFNISNILNTASIIKELRKKTRKTNPDIVYYNSSFGIPLLKDLMAIKLSGCRKYTKVILHIHFADADKLLSNAKLLAKIAFSLMKNTVDHIVFLSKKTKNSFVGMGLEENKTSVIYNFHNVKMTEQELNIKISEVNKKNKTELLFIGSIDERKGILDLLSSLSQLTIDYHLSICGKPIDCDINKKIEVAMKKLPLGAVEQKGFISGVEKECVLKNADILILPSYGEGFPIVLLEGIASANALITTDVGAIPEVFNSENGYIIKPGDINSLANSIMALTAPNEIVKIMKNNYLLSKKYSLEAFVTEMANVCKKVTDE